MVYRDRGDVCTASAGSGFAADPRYPDWPCAQAKVPEISLAAIWAGPPLDDVQDKWKSDAKVSAPVSKLSARRVLLEEAQGDRGISRTLDRREDHNGKTAVRRPVRYAQFPAFPCHERAGTRDAQAARGSREDPGDTIALQVLQDATLPDQPVDELRQRAARECSEAADGVARESVRSCPREAGGGGREVMAPSSSTRTDGGCLRGPSQ